MDCCLNKLGIFPHNVPLRTGILATQAGDHLLYMKAASSNTFVLKKTLIVGQEIIFPVGQLNENMAYDFKIQQPNDVFISSNDCEKFNVITTINTQIDDCPDNCNPDPDSNNYYGY